MMVLRILDGYIARAILRATLLTILALAFMLVFFTFLDELDDVHQEQYQTFDAFKVALLSAPAHLYEIFPVAALIGGLLGLGSLSNHAELVAMRAGGFSLKDIIYAVLKVGLGMSLVVVLVGEWLAPLSAQYAQQLRLAKQKGQVTSTSGQGFWAKDGNQYVNIEHIMSGSHLQGITLYQFNDKRELVFHSYAESADYQDGYWLLHAMQKTLFRPDQVLVEKVEQVRWDSVLDPSLLSVVVLKPDRLPIWDLYRYMRFMQANGQDAVSYRVTFWSRLITPVLALFMLLLALPFALTRQRSGTGQRILVGALLGAVFFLLMRTASYAAVVYSLNPLLLMLAPVLICFALIVGLLRTV